MTHLPLTLSTIASAMAVGFVPVLVDHLRQDLVNRFGISMERAERWTWLFYLAWLPAMPLAGWVFDNYVTKSLLFFGLFFSVLAVIALLLANTPLRAKAAFVGLGIAYSMVAVVSIWEMPFAFDFRAQNSQVAAFNLGFVFVVLGAMGGMFGLQTLEKRLGFRQAFLYSSFLLFVPAILTAITPSATFGTERLTVLTLVEVLRDPFVVLLVAALLLYFILENCTDIWPPRYLQEVGYTEFGLPWVMAAFWTFFLLARLLVGLFAPPVADIWIVLSLVLLASFTLGNMAGAHDRFGVTVGFLIVGFSYGPLLPGLLGLVMPITEKETGAPSALALGCLLSLSGLDTVVFRPIVTALAKNWQPRSFLRIPIGLGLLIGAPLLIIALMAISPTGGR